MFSGSERNAICYLLKYTVPYLSFFCKSDMSIIKTNCSWYSISCDYYSIEEVEIFPCRLFLCEIIFFSNVLYLFCGNVTHAMRSWMNFKRRRPNIKKYYYISVTTKSKQVKLVNVYTFLSSHVRKHAIL